MLTLCITLYHNIHRACSFYHGLPRRKGCQVVKLLFDLHGLKFVKRSEFWPEERNTRGELTLVKENGGLEECLKRLHMELQAIINRTAERTNKTIPLSDVQVAGPPLVDSSTWHDHYIGHGAPTLPEYSLCALRAWFNTTYPGYHFQISMNGHTQITFPGHRGRRTQGSPQPPDAA